MPEWCFGGEWWSHLRVYKRGIANSILRLRFLLGVWSLWVQHVFRRPWNLVQPGLDKHKWGHIEQKIVWIWGFQAQGTPGRFRQGWMMGLFQRVYHWLGDDGIIILRQLDLIEVRVETSMAHVTLTQCVKGKSKLCGTLVPTKVKCNSAYHSSTIKVPQSNLSQINEKAHGIMLAWYG